MTSGIDSSSDESEVDCPNCGEQVEGYNLEYHLDTAHKHRCDRCCRDFVDATALRQHLESSSRHHYCRWCGLDFDSDNLYRSHIMMYHGSCAPCGLDFVNEEYRNRHFESSPNHIYCYQCDRHFTSADHLKHHIASRAHQERNVSCFHPSCPRTFISVAATVAHYDAAGCCYLHPSVLNDRMREVDNNHWITTPGFQWGETGRFYCRFCNKRFDLMSGAVSHVAGGRCGSADDKAQYMIMVENLTRLIIDQWF